MKHYVMSRHWLVAPLAVLVCCASVLWAADNASMVDRILALVNSEIITLSELEKFKALMNLNVPEQGAPAVTDQQLLEQLIERKMIEQEAKKIEVEVKEKEVDQAFDDILKRNKITVPQLQEHLAKQRLTVDEYRKMLRSEIVQSQVVGRQVHATIVISDKEMEEYYQQNIKPHEKPGARVHLRQILLRVPPDALAEKISETELITSQIREKISAGEDFEKMAAAYSQSPEAQLGGDLGYFAKGELLPELEQVAFGLEKGQLSPVIRTSIGFHILRVEDKDAGDRERSWKNYQNDIAAVLHNRACEKRYKEWMEGLRKSTYVEINH